MKCLPSCISTLASKGSKSTQQRRREPLGVRLFTCLHMHGATFSIRRASRVRRGRALGLQSVMRKACHLASNTPHKQIHTRGIKTRSTEHSVNISQERTFVSRTHWKFSRNKVQTFSRAHPHIHRQTALRSSYE